MFEQKNSYLNIFLTLFLPYFILITLLSIMGFFLYYQSLKISENQVRQKNVFLLQEVQESLSSFIIDSDKVFSHLSYVCSSFNLSDHSENADKRELSGELFNIDISKSLIPTELFHDLILDYYVLIESPAVILNHEISLPIDTYLKYNFEFTDSEIKHIHSYFNNQVTEHSSFTDIISLREQSDQPGLTYLMGMMRSFGGAYSGQRGVIILYIDKAAFVRTLEKIDISHDGGVFIIDEEGHIDLGTAHGEYFSSILEKSELTDKDLIQINNDPGWFVSEINIPGHPFRYLTFQSRDYLHDQTKRISYFLMTFIAILICLGIVFSLIIAYMNSKPVNEIFQEFQKKSYLDDVSDMKLNVPGGLFSVFNFKVQKLSEYLDEQTKHLEENVIERLLNGYFINEKDRKEIIESKLNKSAAAYTVILISTTSDNIDRGNSKIVESALWKPQMKIFLDNFLTENVYIYDHKPGEMILLHQKHYKYGVDIFIESLYKSILNDDFSNTRIAVGGSVATIEDISQSYEQAILVRDRYIMDNNIDILRYSEKDESTLQLYIPVDFERRLINSVISGDIMTLSKTFEDIYQKNFLNTAITFPLIRILVNSISSILLIITQRISIENKELEISIKKLLNVDVTIINYIDYFNNLKEILGQLTCFRTLKQNDHKAKMVKTLCKYIDNNYKNPLLSADLVGSELGITGNYVFKLFKEYYRTSFHQYVEHIRMNYAKGILKEDKSRSIKEVAYNSGYSSINTFYKAFKKNFGMSAGDYRRSIT